MEVLWAFLILAGIGLIFGFILALAGKIFYVKEDTRASDIKELLPNYNCGACGYPGCSGFANAIVEGKENKLSKCKPGKKDENFQKIKDYLDEHPNEDGSKIEVSI